MDSGPMDFETQLLYAYPSTKGLAGWILAGWILTLPAAESENPCYKNPSYTKIIILSSYHRGHVILSQDNYFK